MEKIKTFAEYQQLASRTCPDLGSEDKNILHMQLGLVTELGETLDIFKKKHAYNKDIDFVNLGEEIADQMWYLANHALIKKDQTLSHIDLAIVNDIAKDNFLNPATPEKKFIVSVNILTQLMGNVLGSKELDVITYITGLVAVCNMWELDFMQILTNNISKLQVRYPEKFTNEAALNRDLNAERKELEVIYNAEVLTENIEGRV